MQSPKMASAAVISETLNKTPHPSERSQIEQDQELSDFSDKEDHKDVSVLTRVVASFATTKSQRKKLTKEERTQKARIQALRLEKEYGKVFRDIGFLLRWFLFLASLGALVLTFVHFSILSSSLVSIYGNVPTCVFQWADWGPCNSTCTTPNGSLPHRNRTVIPESIIDMRNLTKDSNLAIIWYQTFKSLVRSKCFQINQTAPCNVYECPMELSELTDFTECKHANMTANATIEKCYQYRKLPERGFVHIDTILPIVKECDCSNLTSFTSPSS